MRHPARLGAAILCLALTGCGIAVPVSTGGAPAGGTSRGKIATAQATHEYPSPMRPPQTAVGGSALAAEAVLAFATAYINWNAQTVSADMRILAARSVGQARSAMALAAAETRRDYELHRAGIANRGQVEAVAPLTGGRDQWVVVTRELTTATASNAYQGLKPAWHVTVATVVELAPRRWVVSGWQPES